MPKNHAPLTAARLRELLSYDPETGVFRRKTSAGGVAIGSIAGNDDWNGYRRIRVHPHSHMAHRLAWLYVHGEWPKHEIDHINGVRDDNRIANLREATPAENQQNRARSRNNKSGFTGVSWHRQSNKWRAKIKVNRKVIWLGGFPDPESAAAAYAAAKANLHQYNPIPRENQK